jgi:proteasome lid subunit RPN8/RPN11
MFSKEILDAFKKHAIEKFPEEACALIINDQLVLKDNIHPTPLEGFTIDDFPLSGLQAVLHSHPKGFLRPSEEDIRGQIASAVTWGLITVNKAAEGELDVSKFLFWGHGVQTPPLLGRSFRHGPSGSDNGGDCYALIKDYFLLEKGVYLPEYPRSEDWFLNGGNLYSDNFENAGFTRISRDEAKEGDVFLAQIRSKVPNHGGIYLGKGMVMHHLQNQLSRREPITRYGHLITHFLRYN